MSSIENGRQKPSLDIFIRICDLLNVTPDYLLLGSMHAQAKKDRKKAAEAARREQKSEKKKAKKATIIDRKSVV